MPRLGKKAKQEWAYFINPNTGRRTYNTICRRCARECKQSYRTKVVACRKYLSKRGKNSGDDIL